MTASTGQDSSPPVSIPDTEYQSNGLSGENDGRSNLPEMSNGIEMMSVQAIPMIPHTMIARHKSKGIRLPPDISDEYILNLPWSSQQYDVIQELLESRRNAGQLLFFLTPLAISVFLLLMVLPLLYFVRPDLDYNLHLLLLALSYLIVCGWIVHSRKADCELRRLIKDLFDSEGLSVDDFILIHVPGETQNLLT